MLYTTPPLTADDFVYESVGQLICSQVDAVVCHMFGYGDLWERGVDLWRLALDAAHRAGLEYWAGLRFNDLHGARFHWPSVFRSGHPEYELGARCGSGMHGPGSIYGERCTGLNHALPEVRRQRLARVREVVTRYDIGGFEWDFLRKPGHYAPDLESGGKLRTAYLRETRAVLNQNLE